MAPGQLNAFSIVNFQRRLKYILAKADVQIAIGGVDFSFNEDRKAKYRPFWSPHFYLITGTANRNQLRRALIKRCQKTVAVPRPIKISPFENVAHRRSYALKTQFVRRIGYDQKKEGKGQVRSCRNPAGTNCERRRAWNWSCFWIKSAAVQTVLSSSTLRGTSFGHAVSKPTCPKSPRRRGNCTGKSGVRQFAERPRQNQNVIRIETRPLEPLGGIISRVVRPIFDLDHIN